MFTTNFGDNRNMKGTCKLCLREGVDLKRSHILPAGVYRMLYKASAEKNQTPWLVTEDAAVQTSRQETAHIYVVSVRIV
jgi:hypothetical protein